MKWCLFLLVIALQSFTTASQDISPKDIFINAWKNLKKEQRVTYNAEVRFKFFDEDDTISIRGKCSLVRDIFDPLFGGKIQIQINDTLIKIYDTRDIYWINIKQKRITSFNADEDQKWSMTGNVSSDVIWEDFLRPMRLQTKANDDFELMNDTTIDEKPCYHLRWLKPDDEEYSDKIERLFIAKDDFIPFCYTSQIKFQGNYQYSEFRILSYQFKTPDDIQLKNLPVSDYPIEQYKQAERWEPEISLDNGTTAPMLIGKRYQEEMRQDTVRFAGKVTLLDFWYMACYPCIKAIPGMEKLHKKYASSDFQIFGVNSYDNNEKRIKRLPRFLEYNPIDYPILLVDSNIPKRYSVKGWPTFFIIDKEGKIQYAKSGYGDSVLEELDRILSELLKH